MDERTYYAIIIVAVVVGMTAVDIVKAIGGCQ
jgi:hypothetical protein